MTTRASKELQRLWRAQGFWRDISLGAAFEAAAARAPEAMLTIHGADQAESISLGELRERGIRLAGALSALGLTAGDVVAIQLPNSLENCLLYQAAAALGCVILPIIPVYGPRELGFILRDCRAKILFIPDSWRKIDFMQRVRDMSVTPDLQKVVVVGTNPAEFLSWQEFEAGAAPMYARGISPDAPAFMVYTSGTTANPKGVLHSANGLLAEVWQGYPDDDPESRILSPYPAGHIAGALAILAHGAAARRAVIFETFEASAAVRYIEEEAISHTSGTPFHYLALLDAAEAFGCNVGSLRACGTGGATVPETLVSRAEAAGIHLFRRYGMSEHPTVSQGADGDTLAERMTTDGRLRPGVEVRIVDDLGEDVASGREGEVATRGPDMFLGYLDPAVDAECWLPGGWFLSGDIGRLDAAGFLTITDRKKDIIIRGGENISSREVEELLLQVPGVREAAAVGFPDDRLGERVAAFVTVGVGATVDLPLVEDVFRAAGAARQKTPERLFIVADFPRTAAGKVRKSDLRHQTREGGSAADPASA